MSRLPIGPLLALLAAFALAGCNERAPATDGGGEAVAFAATVTIRDHRFEPAEVRVPAGRGIALTVVNDDPTPEEFESHDLDREKIVAGNASILIKLGPLDAGRYAFFGEFNEATAQGALIAE